MYQLVKKLVKKPLSNYGLSFVLWLGLVIAAFKLTFVVALEDVILSLVVLSAFMAYLTRKITIKIKSTIEQIKIKRSIKVPRKE